MSPDSLHQNGSPRQHIINGSALHPVALSPSQRSAQGMGPPQSPSSSFDQMPVRHPRPLTAAEVHLELEKEQEAVVNRLTRELSALRAQHSASVGSNTSSSNSNGGFDSSDTPSLFSITGPTHPTPTRQHRSSSSLSNRSTRSTSTATFPPVPVSSQASVERARDAGGMRSRQNSSVAVGTSVVSLPVRSSAPSPSPGLQTPNEAGYFPAPTNRTSLSSMGSTSQARSPSASRQRTSDFDLTTRLQAELAASRREADMLSQRVRELERQLRAERRSRAESDVSTNASVTGSMLGDASSLLPEDEREKASEHS